jgi:hypothetical protein
MKLNVWEGLRTGQTQVVSQHKRQSAICDKVCFNTLLTRATTQALSV